MKRPRKGPSVSEKLQSARANRYKVIHERNLLILALAKHGVGCSAHVVPTGTNEPGTWKHVLCLHTPAGQIHWKLSPEDAADFRDRLAFDKKSDWDGAKADEKNKRLERLHTLPRSTDAVTKYDVTEQMEAILSPQGERAVKRGKTPVRVSRRRP